MHVLKRPREERFELAVNRMQHWIDKGYTLEQAAASCQRGYNIKRKEVIDGYLARGGELPVIEKGKERLDSMERGAYRKMLKLMRDGNSLEMAAHCASLSHYIKKDKLLDKFVGEGFLDLVRWDNLRKRLEDLIQDCREVPELVGVSEALEVGALETFETRKRLSLSKLEFEMDCLILRNL